MFLCSPWERSQIPSLLRLSSSLQSTLPRGSIRRSQAAPNLAAVDLLRPEATQLFGHLIESNGPFQHTLSPGVRVRARATEPKLNPE